MDPQPSSCRPTINLRTAGSSRSAEVDTSPSLSVKLETTGYDRSQDIRPVEPSGSLGNVEAAESTPPRPRATSIIKVKGDISPGNVDMYQDPNAGKTTPEMQPTYRGPWPRSRLGEHKIFTADSRRDIEIFANDGKPKLGPGPTDDEAYLILDPDDKIPTIDLEICIPARPLRVGSTRKASKSGCDHLSPLESTAEDQGKSTWHRSSHQATHNEGLSYSVTQRSPPVAPTQVEDSRQPRSKRPRLEPPARQTISGIRPRSAHDYEDDDRRVRYWLKEADLRAETTSRETADSRRAAWATKASVPARAVSQPSMLQFSRAEGKFHARGASAIPVTILVWRF